MENSYAAWRRSTLGRAGVAVVFALGQIAIVVIIPPSDWSRDAGLALMPVTAAVGVPVSMLLAWVNVAVAAATLTDSNGEASDLDLIYFALPETVASAVLAVATRRAVACTPDSGW